MIVYVAGYPKSGTTWITRLLGDALDCRTGGSIPKEDSREIASEGFDRKNTSCIIRKGHSTLNDTPSTVPVIRAHQMFWKGLNPGEHRVVFVVRDPRDIAVSAAHHWNIEVRSTLANMIYGTNNFRSVGPWNDYIERWFDRARRFKFYTVHYEKMLEGPELLQNLLLRMDFIADARDVADAYERQSFANRLKDIEARGKYYNLGEDFNRRFMRKGVAGDWRNHFTRKEAFDVEVTFGELLRSFNYESTSTWWKDVQ